MAIERTIVQTSVPRSGATFIYQILNMIFTDEFSELGRLNELWRNIISDYL